MRKLLTSVIILLIIQFQSFAQWQWLNPKPSGYINSSVVFTDPQNGYIINTNGDLLSTKDQGATWNLIQHFDGSVNTMNIAYTTGIIAGSSNLFLSIDNGITWQKIITGITANFRYVDIVSRDTIFIAGDNSKIYKTTDRGQTWQTLDCGVTIGSIDFVNSKVGYIGASSQSIRKTIDGGQTWTTSLNINSFPSGTLVIKFVTIDTGYAYREFSDMLRTTDGGVTWNTFTNISGDMYAVSFPSTLIGFMGGEDGAMYRTQNGGISWEWIGPTGRVDATDIYSIYFINNDIGFAVGHRGRILKTTDRGTTWQQYGTTYIDMTSLAFGSKATGYATAWNNIYKTTNSGATWIPLALTVGTAYADNSRFSQSHFSSTDTGIVTASSPARTYKTFDGGQNWQRINIGQTLYNPGGFENFSDVNFINKYIGIASLTVGAYFSGALYKTNDGGDTWKEIESGQDFSLIDFLDEKNGYAAKYSSMYKTKDSGRTWTQIFQNDIYQIQAICFINAKTGFMGDDQGLKKSNDSGKTWSILPINYADRNIISIQFYNSKVGYFTSGGGAIYKTIDAGLTWLPDGKSAFYDCPNISFNSDTVYVAGMYGAILKSEIATSKIDSLNITSLSSCSTGFSAIVTAVLSSADSIQFEYGKNNFNNVVAATPGIVNDTTIKVSAAANLQPDSSYFVRVKYYYKGKYLYSNATQFTTPTPAAISASVTQQPTCSIPTGTITVSSPAPANGMTYSIDGINYTNISGIFNSVVPGTYNVTTKINGCTSASKSVTVNAASSLPSPTTINGPAFVCQNSIQNYSVAAVPGAVSYNWTLPSGWIGTSTTNTIAVTSGISGGAITVAANSGCGLSATQSLNVTINPIPSITSKGDSVLISSTAPFYQWFFNNKVLSGENFMTLKIKKTGFYRVETSSDKTCWSASIDYPVLALIDQLPDTLSMEIYPNPAINNFNVVIRLQQVATVSVFVTIVNSSGNVVLQTNKLIFYGNEIKIPISLTTKGTFFVKVDINGDIKTLPVVLQ